MSLRTLRFLSILESEREREKKKRENIFQKLTFGAPQYSVNDVQH